jgi:hypothetical protein
VSRRHRVAKPAKFIAYRAGGLKGRLSALAIHGAQWGWQSCLQPPFRRLANPEDWRSRRFFGFVSCRYRDGKPEKFVKGRACRLKAGCSQDWLPHKRAKAQGRAERAPLEIGHFRPN